MMAAARDGASMRAIGRILGRAASRKLGTIEEQLGSPALCIRPWALTGAPGSRSLSPWSSRR